METWNFTTSGSAGTNSAHRICKPRHTSGRIIPFQQFQLTD
uniref:Uncharacterized protein n=1 Tax=Arundo donax TaxID=35708 RepID=A0A0A9HFR4_ARUDO